MKAQIVFASMTGNDEDMAEILEENLQDAGLPRRVTVFSGQAQGDAAAKLDDDDESCGDGGAQAATEVARGRR